MRKLLFTLSLIAVSLVAAVGHRLSAQVGKAPLAPAPSPSSCPNESDQVTSALDGTYTQVGFSIGNGMKPVKFTVKIENGNYKVREQGTNTEERVSRAVIKTGAQPEFTAALAGRILEKSCLFKTEMDLRNSGTPIKLTIVRQWSREDSPRVTFYLTPAGGSTPQVIIPLYDQTQQEAVDNLWARFNPKSN